MVGSPSPHQQPRISGSVTPTSTPLVCVVYGNDDDDGAASPSNISCTVGIAKFPHTYPLRPPEHIQRWRNMISGGIETIGTNVPTTTTTARTCASKRLVSPVRLLLDPSTRVALLCQPASAAATP
jgi:hypothetical protein